MLLERFSLTDGNDRDDPFREHIAEYAQILQDPLWRGIDRDVVDEHVFQLRTEPLHPLGQLFDQIAVIRDRGDLPQTGRDDVDEIMLIHRLEQEALIALPQECAQPQRIALIEKQDQDALRKHLFDPVDGRIQLFFITDIGIEDDQLRMMVLTERISLLFVFRMQKQPHMIQMLTDQPVDLVGQRMVVFDE